MFNKGKGDLPNLSLPLVCTIHTPLTPSYSLHPSHTLLPPPLTALLQPSYSPLTALLHPSYTPLTPLLHTSFTHPSLTSLLIPLY